MYCNTTIILQTGMAGLVSQYNGLYHDQGGEPSCRIVSQYSSLYCDTGAREMGRVVLQYSHCTSDTVRRLGARGTQGAGRRTDAGRAARQASGALRHGRGARPRHDQTLPRHGHTCATMSGLGAACAHLGVLLGCGLCTWCTQPVFDLV